MKHSFKVVIDENRFWDLYNNPIEPACKNQPILRTEYEIILEKIKTLAKTRNINVKDAIGLYFAQEKEQNKDSGGMTS